MNKIFIGEKKSKYLNEAIDLIVRLVSVYYPEVDAIIMKNYYDEKIEQIDVILYLYLNNTNKLIPVVQSNLKLGKYECNIKTSVLSCINDVLVNGKIIYDKSKKITRLKKNFEYMVELKNKFKENDNYVELDPPIDISKIKKLSK